MACYQQAVSLEPQLAEAQSNLGNALKWSGRPAEAVEHYEAAMRAKPGFIEVWVNLASVFQDLDRYLEAQQLLQQALQQRPDLPDSHCNLGYTLERLGRLPGRSSATSKPSDCVPITRSTLEPGLGLLGNRRLAARLARIEWRWAKPGMSPLRSPQPRWDGSKLDGRTILLYDEQGLGDTLQFVRDAASSQRGGKVVLRCQRSLMPLLAHTAGIDHLVARDEPLPPFDVHVPLLSLPGILGTTLETVPAAVPYLHVDPQRAGPWRQELAQGPEFRIGIVWKGNADQAMERFRSVPLEHFARLAPRRA